MRPVARERKRGVFSDGDVGEVACAFDIERDVEVNQCSVC